MANGHLRKSDSQDKLNADSFDEAPKCNESTQKALEQEAVRSLLNLSALGEPSQWSTSTGNFFKGICFYYARVFVLITKKNIYFKRNN